MHIPHNVQINLYNVLGIWYNKMKVKGVNIPINTNKFNYLEVAS